MRILVAHQAPGLYGRHEQDHGIHSRSDRQGRPRSRPPLRGRRVHGLAAHARTTSHLSLKVRHRAMLAARSGRPYDIINVHEPSAAFVATGNRAAGSPVIIITSHGLERRAWQLAKEESRRGREGPLLRTRVTYPVTSLWPAQLALRRADHVFCLSSDDRDYLMHTMRRPASSITRIMPGAMCTRAAAGRDYSRRERLLFAATWRKNKGVEDLVPAFAALAERHPRLVLNVVGAGIPVPTVLSRFPEHIRHESSATLLPTTTQWPRRSRRPICFCCQVCLKEHP